MTKLLLAFTILFPLGPYECDSDAGELACVPHDAALPIARCTKTGNTGNKYPKTTYLVGRCMIGDTEYTVWCPAPGYPGEGEPCSATEPN